MAVAFYLPAFLCLPTHSCPTLLTCLSHSLPPSTSPLLAAAWHRHKALDYQDNLPAEGRSLPDQAGACAAALLRRAYHFPHRYRLHPHLLVPRPPPTSAGAGACGSTPACCMCTPACRLHQWGGGGAALDRKRHGCRGWPPHLPTSA